VRYVGNATAVVWQTAVTTERALDACPVLLGDRADRVWGVLTPEMCA
jgi:hypothetical protein